MWNAGCSMGRFVKLQSYSGLAHLCHDAQLVRHQKQGYNAVKTQSTRSQNAVNAVNF